MVVEVGLGAIERDGSHDAEDLALADEASRRQRARWPEADQVRDRGRSRPEQPRLVLERLYVPAFDAAGESGREACVAFRCRGRDAGADGGGCSDKSNQQDATDRPCSHHSRSLGRVSALNSLRDDQRARK
jgi:hypothetical protein